jgi:chaperonin cofactor prefoldin
MMRIPMMLLGLMAFDTKCTITAFQPRSQRTARMTTLRFQHSFDDLPVAVAVLENKMNAMTKTLERVESKIDTTLDEIDTNNNRMDTMTKTLERIESKTDELDKNMDVKMEWMDSQLWFLTMSLPVLDAIFNSYELTAPRLFGIVYLAVWGVMWIILIKLIVGILPK